MTHQAVVDLGTHGDDVAAVAVPPDGRIVTGGDDGQLLLWTPGSPDGTPVGCAARHDGGIRAVAALPDGRVVSGGADGRLLMSDTRHPRAAPIEAGSHAGAVRVVAVLDDGRVVSGGGDGLRIWNGDGFDPIACSVRTLATASSSGGSDVVVVHEDGSSTVFATARTDTAR